MAIITLQGVNYTYGKKTPYEKHALNNINLDIERGAITGIIGHTGSGKSTMVQMFNGLLRANEGKVIVDGKDIWEKPKEIGKIRYKVGMVMQYPEYQLFAETVREDIAYGPTNMGVDKEEIAKRVEQSAAFCGIDSSVFDKSPFDLSGGQKRRVALAGIMAMNPEVLVLDEPAAGLDPRGRREILNGIKNYRDKTGASVVIVSHSMEDMAQYCDRLVVMSKGSIILEGTCKEVFSQGEILKSSGLDVPEISNIASVLRKKGVDISRDLYTVEDTLKELSKYFDKGGLSDEI